MSEPLYIKLFLGDGALNGYVKGEIDDRDGLLYCVSRQVFQEHRDDESMKQSGIYFLLGYNAQGVRTVYVGQADKRSNGNGINQRLD